MKESIPHSFILRHTLRGHEKAILSICWSPNGKVLASGSEEGIYLWDMQQAGQPIRTIGRAKYAHVLVWSPDGTILAVGANEATTPIRCTLGHANPVGSPYCEDCGEPLGNEATTPIYCTLGHRNPAGSAFCDDCGEPLGAGSLFSPRSSLLLFSAEDGKLLYNNVLPGKNDTITGLEWSPDGTMLAFSDGSAVHLFSVQKKQGRKASKTGQQYLVEMQNQSVHPLESILPNVMAQSHDGTWLTLAGSSLALTCPSCEWKNIKKEVFCDKCGEFLVQSGNKLFLANTATWQVTNEFVGHTGRINAIVWAPDQAFFVSGSDDGTIRIWKPDGQQHILEGFITNVTSLSLSSDGSLLASRSTDGNICIWDTIQWEMRAIVDTPPSDHLARVAFHPQAPILATLSENNTVITIWNIDVTELLLTPPVVASSSYKNAKIVLVGETGVGKSGLNLALTGQTFEPTESTHGRKVQTFEQQNLRHVIGQKEQRELLLWDLAGQPGYRLIHQLYLNETSVALVVFDSRSETDPLAGVDYWVRALRVARRTPKQELAEGVPMKMFLVAARIDRGGKNIGSGRREKIIKKEGFDGYFETSAKEGTGIAELTEAIRQAVDWEKLTTVTSSLLFQRIKDFLVSEKVSKRLLATYADLLQEFCQTNDSVGRIKDIATQFKLCIKQIEQKGLIKQLSFKEYILLQPELLDSYASALVIAVRDEPDELGSISEQRVLTGDFAIPNDARINDRDQERLLLIAMVKDLLAYEIALREDWEDGPYLVFPSQSMRENPDLPTPEGKAAIFTFEGAIANIYATLVVRLSRSGLFRKVDLWRNAVTYTTEEGGSYGIFLHTISEGCAELTLFFDETVKEETCFHFEEYIRIHLHRLALPETVKRRPIFVCLACETPLDDLAVRRRKERKFTWMICGVCDVKVSLLDRQERLAATPDSLVSEMDSMADRQRDQSTAESSLQGKIATGDFDVFLCYNKEDRPAVKRVGEQLKENGILPWLDEWELRPGIPWQPALEQQIGQIKAAAVFVGKNGIGPWEEMELAAFLREFVRRHCPVIPVILADAPKEPALPLFLAGMTWVDFRQQDPAPLKRLMWGITGKRETH